MHYDYDAPCFSGTTNLEELSNEQILIEYKNQQGVERGFRFLKDPWFMVDSVFLKSPRRIEALMVIMTLCLLIYNVAQHKLRTALKTKNETLPNQLNKPIQNPTLKWIFQIMEGVGVLKLFDPVGVLLREMVTQMDALRTKIVTLFGMTAQKIYEFS